MSVTAINSDRSDDGYEKFSAGIGVAFARNAGDEAALFTTNAPDLFDIFLANVPEDGRQHYTCHACRKFVDTYGGLVSISPDGDTVPVMWDAENAPPFFKKAVTAVARAVKKAKVNGAFVSSNDVWGTPVTGEWHHMHVIPLDHLVWDSRVQTAAQASAEKLEDFKALIASLKKFPVEAVNQAVKLLRADALHSSERVLGVAEWLKELHEKQDSVKSKQRKRNLVWLAAATAPAGFCHVNSTMIGTLLNDIVDGLPYEAINRRFAEKMHPLQYQRPQVVPTAGNVAQAEKLVEQMGAAESLKRRFARLDEIQAIWTPSAVNEDDKAGGGVFSHLETSNGKPKVADMDAPTLPMTWRKFRDEILPTAVKIEYMVMGGKDNFAALVTAEDADAPPIVQWDNEEQRNPVSWYVYQGGSYPRRWGLASGFCEVTAVCLQPSMWYGEYFHQGKSVIFILDGAKDKDNQDSALFPAILRSEFHGIRATIEAYSKTKELGGYEEASACGILLPAGRKWGATIKVTTDIGAMTYHLDRWD